MERLDKAKLLNDYVNNINTLSTGSIVILVTFIEKVFTKPCGKWLVAVSLISFLISVIGGVSIKTDVTLDTYLEFDMSLPSKRHENIEFYSWLMFMIGFLLGLISLAIFGVINLFQ